MTVEQAWDQLAEWTTAGHRVFWKRSEDIYTLYVYAPGAEFPFEVASTDKLELRVIDCVQRMRRAMAFPK